MSFLHQSSSALGSPPDTSASLMRWVLIASLPGIVTLTVYFGLGVITNILIAAFIGIGLEAAFLRLRQRAIMPAINDGSALVTAILLGVSLPSASPWWLISIGMIAAIVVAKQLYGGLGHNPFNPAMVGYALLLVSFPTYMTLWSPPQPILSDTLWRQVLGILPVTELDALSGATPLDAFKHKGATVMASEFWASQPLPPGTLEAWQNAAWAWAAGGALLLYKRVISWHIPVAMLGSLMLLSALFYAGDTSHFAPPSFHLLTGAAVFGAFFIATDPVSAATCRRGKLIYGMGIGVLVILIRTWGGYPDAVAFAVLLMNLCVPLLDLYSDPRVAGHIRASRGHRPPGGPL